MSIPSGINNDIALQYEQLKSIVNGTYNKGEVVFDKKSGKFDKINNHEFINWNFWKVSPEQNRETRDAIYNVVEAHLREKWNNNSIVNSYLTRLDYYLRHDNIGKKVERDDIRWILNSIDNGDIIGKTDANSRARTDFYNNLAQKIVSSGLPSNRQNELLNICSVRLLGGGRRAGNLSDEKKNDYTKALVQVLQCGMQNDEAKYAKALEVLKNGFTLPKTIDAQNEAHRKNELDSIMSKYGPNGNADRSRKLSDEEQTFLNRSLLGNNSSKPLTYESRRQLAAILDEYPAGEKRMSELGKWANATLNIVPKSKNQTNPSQPQVRPTVSPQRPQSSLSTNSKLQPDTLDNIMENVGRKVTAQKAEASNSIVSVNATNKAGDLSPTFAETKKLHKELGDKYTECGFAPYSGPVETRASENDVPVLMMNEYTAAMKKALKNKAFMKEASQQVRDLQTGADFYEKNPELMNVVVKDLGAVRTERKNPFRGVQGTSVEVAARLLFTAIRNGTLDQTKISLSIFADSTYCGCGIFKNFSTQEESTFRDFGLLLLAFFKDQGLVKEVTDEKGDTKFEYVKKNGKQLSPAGDGFMVSAPLMYHSMVEIDWPKKDRNGNSITVETLVKHLCLQFRSAVSFDAINKCNEDVFGDVQYKSDYMRFFGGKAGKKMMTESEVATTQSFLKDLYPAIREATKGVKDKAERMRLGHEMLAVFLFTDEFDALASSFSVTGKTRSSEIKRLTNMVMAGRHTELLKIAEENHIKTMRLKIRQDILMARANGVKQFIGGPIGSGAFDNDPELMGRLYAEEFDKYASKDMVFVCPTGVNTRKSIENFNKFEAGFKSYYEEKSKNLDAVEN